MAGVDDVPEIGKSRHDPRRAFGTESVVPVRPVRTETEPAVGMAESLDEVGALEVGLDIHPPAGNEVFQRTPPRYAHHVISQFRRRHREAGMLARHAEAAGEIADDLVIGPAFSRRLDKLRGPT